MTTTRVFRSGNGQALHIPKELRTNREEFMIRKVGEVYIAFPADDPWAPTRQAIGAFPEDFMAERDQPSWDSVPEREA